MGIADRSAEVSSATLEGVKKARSVRRRSELERRSKALVDSTVGSPWCPLPPPVVPAAIGPRRLLKHGYSVGCPGCDAARSNTVAKPHSDACRMRIEQAMVADEVGAARAAHAVERRAARNEGKRPKRRAARDEAAENEASPAKRRAHDDVPMPPVAEAPREASAASSSTDAAASLSLALVARELCALGTHQDVVSNEEPPQLDLHASVLRDLQSEVNVRVKKEDECIILNFVTKCNQCVVCDLRVFMKGVEREGEYFFVKKAAPELLACHLFVLMKGVEQEGKDLEGERFVVQNAALESVVRVPCASMKGVKQEGECFFVKNAASRHCVCYLPPS